MSHPKLADLQALITALAEAGVEFIVVGGAAAVLHGAPVTTIDLDIVHRQTPDNVDRLLRLLGQLDAFVREPANRQLRPTAAWLTGRGQLTLSTSLGPLDPLCRLHDGRGYDELLAHSVAFADGSAIVRALDLPTLIQVKTEAGRAKDRLVVPVLLALLKKQSGA